MEASVSGARAGNNRIGKKVNSVKILFSISYYHPYISGLTLAAARWAEALVKKGETVTVLTMQHDKSLTKRRSIHGVRIERVPWLIQISKGFLSVDWPIRTWRQVGRHNVVVIHLPQVEGIVVAICAKLQGKRIISVYHCEPELPSGFIPGVIQSIMEVSHFFTLLLSDKVATYTKDYADHSTVLRLWKQYTKRDIVAVIPPIAPPKENTGLTRSFAKRIGHSDVTIGVAARLAAEKGIEHVIEALPLLKRKLPRKRIILVIAGPMDPVGEGAYKTKIMALVGRFARQVIFLGSIAPTDMGSFYRCIDVLVLPSVNRTEAFGMVQVEAMYMGVPVVASNLPGVRVPVQKTGMGLVVPPGDSARLAEAIHTIMLDKHRYTSAKKPISTLFSPPRSVSAFLSLIS